MSASAIVASRNLSIANVSVSEPRKNAKGGISVQLKYNGQPLQIRLPKMKFPGGALVREDDKTGKVDYKLIGSLTGCDPYNTARAGPEAGDTGTLYNFLHDLDEKLIETAVANSSKWFGKTRGREGVSDSYRAILTASSDRQPDGSRVPNGKYPPSIAIKFPVWDGVVKTAVIDSKGNPMEIRPENVSDIFPKRVECNLVISPSIYVVNQSFGVSWRIDYAQVFPTERLSARAVFADEDFGEEEGDAPTATNAAAAFQDDVDDTPAPESVKPPTPMPIETSAAVPPSRRRRAV